MRFDDELFDELLLFSEVFRDRSVLKRRPESQCKKMCEKRSALFMVNTMRSLQRTTKTRPQTSETRQVNQTRPTSLKARWQIKTEMPRDCSCALVFRWSDAGVGIGILRGACVLQ